MTEFARARDRTGVWWVLGGLLLVFAAWRIVVLALDPDRRPDAALEQAREAAAAGDAERAARLARQALAERPLDGRPYEVLAALARAVGADPQVQRQLYSARSPAHVYELLHAEESQDFNYFLQ